MPMDAPNETLAEPEPDNEDIRLDAFMPFQLAVVANRVSQAIARLIETGFNLHIPEWRILATLNYHAPVSSQFLVQHTAMDPARVSRAQTRLSDLGLISVTQDPADKRKVIITLTEKGTQITQAIAPEARLVEERMMAHISPQERVVFEQVLSKLFQATTSE
ncbi:MAG: MarR family transcriptional regulator [Roseitalea sp.]|jgi:DNA-binding MarR family transcriptional regulator|uniref:MarR family transcriptional regulator n=1 Tax=Oceaniradius stylonematis TaxID=2184161 RepID=A0A3A8A8L1_9HYPH|nr:MarR family transcriptional regulator [Oceaniradius stylonematis]MBO6554543.1 MarR family transcriptional regulator [Roseitalea sp.]MBO6953586.1 MarR family transcriptional regulator [Rhizobiaceae bacterium]RNC93499.1 MAG: MarR family transcriptional regulator [Oricola sp.]MBO6593985.1 MarR family transcriptional regulator [Roseitalea sp.]MBO6601330.1 MarR family transcriptional regulator [Roseitalea sp.]